MKPIFILDRTWYNCRSKYTWRQILVKILIRILIWHDFTEIFKNFILIQFIELIHLNGIQKRNLISLLLNLNLYKQVTCTYYTKRSYVTY